MRTECPRSLWKVVPAVGLVVAMTIVAGAQEVPRGLERDLRVMEDLISEMLIDSPNLLVSSGGPVYGFYIAGVGAVFNLETSLVTRSHRDGFLGLRGGRVLLWDDDDDDWEDEDEEDDEAIKRLRSKRSQRASRCYERGVDELKEVLADAGGVLDELQDQDWVMIAAALEDHSYFRKEKISRLVLKTRMSDLRAREAGTISAEQMEQRIQMTVY